MRVVWTSDWSTRPVATGFSRASRQILKYLHSQKHEVIEVAVGYEGYGDEGEWKMYPTTAYNGRVEGQDIAGTIARNARADALVLFMDVPDLAWAIQYVDKAANPLQDQQVEALDKREFALCMYSPIDGCCPNGKAPGSWYKVFGAPRTFDSFAAPSRFGQRILSECVGQQAAYLPHGVDLETFRPLPGAPKEFRKRLGLPEDNFTLVYVGVNKRRKQLPALYETVAKLQDRLPDVPLTVVAHGDTREDYYDLQGLVDIYGVEARGASVWHTKHLTDEGLGWLYNSADVLVHLAGGEGFGIPIIEAQACRIPALVTDYSAMSEVVPDAEMGWCRVPVKALISHPMNNIAMAWPDTDAAADRLAAFWKDKGLRVRLRKASWENAQQYAWPRVAPRVERWLEQAVANKKQFYSKIRVEAVVA